MDATTLSPLAQRLGAAFPELARSAATLERIASRGAYRQVPAGGVMFNEHSPCNGFPLVLAGSVRVVQRFPNGREIQLYRVKSGESCLLSGSCLLGNSDYAASGVAETAVELVVIPPAEFRALVAGDEVFREHVFSLYGERLAALMQLVEAISWQKLDQRLAALLIGRTRDGATTLQATHQALADELGSVREIVSRLLRSFEDRGWVELGRERITVRDAASLAALAKG
ncbi:MAG: Crp/Fnr family transcriptional regulator [Betaproteobacteria bacterium]|jgi:CRP/FNR family transcriptional regulator|nr:Crp/Fnr family transcriptional regulator [Betaproteobacteria bacterium]MDH5285663.1 Crp/Fnr family transcriptional regulator [Betaproteobacteria bacterium]